MYQKVFERSEENYQKFRRKHQKFMRLNEMHKACIKGFTDFSQKNNSEEMNLNG